MTKSHNKARALVVGAGFAGLSAGWHLKKSGIDAPVLEANNRVGGIAHSVEIDGRTIEVGAQFLTNVFPTVMAMVKEAGLDRDLYEASPWVAVTRNGAITRIRSDYPFNALGLVGFRNTVRFIRAALSMWRQLRGRSADPFSEWTSFHDETLADWLERVFGAHVREYLMEPVIQGAFFQTPEASSKVLGVLLLAMMIDGEKVLTLPGGNQSVAEAIAEQLDVRLNTPVEHIEETEQGVIVHAGQETWLADQVIVTPSAPVAASIIDTPHDDLMAQCLQTTYGATLKVTISMDTTFRLPKALARVYPLMIPVSERDEIASVIFPNNQNRPGDEGNPIIQLMLTNEAAIQRMNEPDQLVVDAAIGSVAPHIPDIAGHVTTARVDRWPYGLPHFPVGCAARLKSYRSQCETQPPRILLAGDYMAMPLIEGAAESAKWAANLVTRAKA